MSRQRFRVFALTALVLGALIASACSSSESSSTDDGSDASGPSGTLRVALMPATVNFDPANFVAGGADYLYPVYDTLLDSSDPAGTQPRVASEWTFDGTTLELTLRDDVTFPDGTEIDAEVVKANLDRNKEIGFTTSEPDLTNMASVTVVDATHVTIELSQPSSGFLDTISGKQGMLVNPSAFDDPELESTPAGSGPYTFEASSSTVGAKYVYTPREDYWDPSIQHVESLELYGLDAAQGAQVNALRSGEVDVASVDANTVDAVLAEGFELAKVSATWFGMIVLDREGTSVEALGDEKVRQAMAYSIDRDAFVEAIYGEFGAPSAQPQSEGQVGFDPELVDAFEYDVDKANELLAEAGYAEGFGFSAATGGDSQVTALQEFFGDIGIDIELIQVAGDQLIPESTNGDYPVMFTTFPQGNVSALAQTFFATGGALNVFDATDPAVDAASTALSEAVEPEAQRVAAAELVNILVTKGYLVVASNGQNATAHTSNVGNVTFSGGQVVRLNILDMTVS